MFLGVRSRRPSWTQITVLQGALRAGYKDPSSGQVREKSNRRKEGSALSLKHYSRLQNYLF